MTLKTITTPLDRLTQDEWRSTIARWVGEAYADMDSGDQTELNRIVDEEMDYVSQRAAHEPWALGETTHTLTADTDKTFAMPVDFRTHMRIIEEATDGKKFSTAVSTKQDFFDLHDGSETHPWTILDKAVWFLDGFDDSEPPQQQWRRVGVARSGATARVLYRPFFNLIEGSGSQDAFTLLPASWSKAIRQSAREQWSLFKKDFTDAQVYRVAKEDAIAALEIADQTETEVPMRLGSDPAFGRLLG